MTAREAIQFVELDIPVCARVYGVAPCAAAIGVTGDIKCFNSVATCQDAAHYSATTVTLRFGEASTYRPLGIDAVPTIEQVTFTAAKIAPGIDLGERATLRVTLSDQPHSDTGPGFDPYHGERGYDPYRQGSMWGKFRARQPYLRGRSLRWFLGYADQPLSEMDMRTFIIESFDGPDVNGIYTLNAIDPLKMLDGDRAQAPAISKGRLQADIDALTTSATLTPTGIGNSEYPSSGYLAIGGTEIVSFTRSGDALTIVRGQLGTAAATHSAADRVQVVKRIVSQDPADIIRDLMVNGAGVPTAWIALADWQAETGAYLRRQYTATIAEPTPVAKLVSELMEQCGLSIWWDDRAAKIRLRVLRSLPASTVTFDDGNVLEGTFTRKEQPDKRISQVWTFYGQINPLKKLDDTDNYRSVAASADLVNEGNYGSPSLRKIFSRWIAPGGLTAAQRTNDLHIGRYGTPPRAFSFSVLRDAQRNPELGAAYDAQWRTEQTPTGAAETVKIQAIRVKPAKDRFVVEAEETTFDSLDNDDLTSRQITINYDDQNLNWRAVHDQLYPAPTEGIAITCTVSAGVTIGSASTALPALDTGAWPTRAQSGARASGSAVITGLSNTAGLAVGMRVTGAGIQDGAKILTVDSGSQITLDKTATSTGTATVTVQTVLLTLKVEGRIQGRGGKGGRGADGQGNVPGENGEAGGAALKVSALIDLVDASGDLWGGGGGGGGGACRDPNDHHGGGGGGGAGTNPGEGGIGPSVAEEGDPGTATAGGDGGRGSTNNNFFAAPSLTSKWRGGDGGDPGQAGSSGVGTSDLARGSGGAAGRSIDGISKVVTVGSAGDRRGPQAG